MLYSRTQCEGCWRVLFSSARRAIIHRYQPRSTWRETWNRMSVASKSYLTTYRQEHPSPWPIYRLVAVEDDTLEHGQGEMLAYPSCPTWDLETSQASDPGGGGRLKVNCSWDARWSFDIRSKGALK